MFTETEKFYINCPYSEKEACKALGGKWDRIAKSWYVPAGISQSRFVRWIQIQARPVLEGKKNNARALGQRIDASEMPTLIRPGQLAELLGVNIRQAMAAAGEYNAPKAQLIGTTKYWKRDEVLNWLASEGL